MSNLILETKNLSKKFGKQLIVDSVSLKIKRNSIYGILGQNGENNNIKNDYGIT